MLVPDIIRNDKYRACPALLRAYNWIKVGIINIAPLYFSFHMCMTSYYNIFMVNIPYSQ